MIDYVQGVMDSSLLSLAEVLTGAAHTSAAECKSRTYKHSDHVRAWRIVGTSG